MHVQDLRGRDAAAQPQVRGTRVMRARQHGTGRNNAAGDPDKRGSVTDRRVRKMWLLAMFGGQCVHCLCTLTYDTVQADRIVPGGSYRRSNIQASCWSCNTARGNNVEWTYEGA